MMLEDTLIQARPPGDFGRDWMTDADEVVLTTSNVLFRYRGGRGDVVTLYDGDTVSLWRYGGSVRITPMIADDLGVRRT